MTEREKCESCIHAKPFGGANDNRCGAWSCEFIDRHEAIEAYELVKAMRETKGIITTGTIGDGRNIPTSWTTSASTKGE